MYVFVEHDKRGKIRTVGAAQAGTTSELQVALRPRRGYSVAVINIAELDNLEADDLATRITELKRSHRVDTSHREARLVRSKAVKRSRR